MFIESITLNYMKNFQCIGPDCNDSCCKDWLVFLSSNDYDIISKKMSTSPELQDELLNKIKVTKTQEGQNRYLIQLAGNNRCVFLNNDQLCSIQCRFGETSMPRICSRFPRQIAIIGQRLEISATLACPETARLCLLDPDAMAIVDVPETMIPDSNLRSFSLDVFNTNPYNSNFDFIRAELVHLLNQRTFPVTTRLFFLSYFANRIGSFFHSQSTGDVTASLKKESQYINNKDIQQDLHKRFSQIDLSEKNCLELIQYLMEDGLADWGPDEFKNLLCQSLMGYGAVRTEGGISIGIADVLDKYHYFKNLWNTEFSKEIDQFQSHFFINSIFNLPYAEYHSVFLYIRNLLLTNVLFKFLLFGLLGNELDVTNKTREDKKKILEQWAVHSVQKLSKFIFHNHRIITTLRARIDQQGLTTLPHSVFLIQF